MLTKLFRRFLIVIGFAGLFSIMASLMTVQAKPYLQQTTTDDCRGCHKLIGEFWADSAHGHAVDDPVFMEAWEKQNKPDMCMACHATGFNPQDNTWDSPGVDCQTCHSPINQNHPDEIMPTDVSSRLCGSCHIDTFNEWQTSVHSNEDLTCNQCHNAHTTTLKTENGQDLCKACHSEQVHDFSLTAHAETGLACTDCHLRISESEMGEGHGKRVHTFEVDLKTCNECHSEEMHNPADGAILNMNDEDHNTLIPDVPVDSIATDPQAVSPTGFTIIGTLIGVAFGMIMAPWLERWFQRFRS